VLTLGVNYYINPNMRVMLNYLDIEAKAYNDATPNESPSAVNMRFALDF
jgi:phosphate-selective porin